jgi:ribosomal protein S18 acetylase RimI-like enzyme
MRTNVDLNEESLKGIKFDVSNTEDAGEILELQKQAFLGQARIYGNNFLPPLVQTLTSITSDYSLMTFFKAVYKGRIIGSVRIREDGDAVHVNRLIVAPEFQNRGVGTLIMKKVEERYGDKRTYRLFTGEKSSRNIHLYTKLGYSVTRREDTPEGIVHLHMEKTSAE